MCTIEVAIIMLQQAVMYLPNGILNFKKLQYAAVYCSTNHPEIWTSKEDMLPKSCTIRSLIVMHARQILSWEWIWQVTSQTQLNIYAGCCGWADYADQ